MHDDKIRALEISSDSRLVAIPSSTCVSLSIEHAYEINASLCWSLSRLRRFPVPSQEGVAPKEIEQVNLNSRSWSTVV